MPWSSDGGPDWNATLCSTIAPLPGEPGDPCTVMGSVYSGVDDCNLGSMCWDVDPDTNSGHCVATCTGSPADPVCADPSLHCVIADDGLITLCLASCDPLLQDCVNGSGCYPADDTFVCSPEGAGGPGGYGDGCSAPNDCDPGLFCAAPEQVPGCDQDEGCCTPLCDRDQPDPNADCLGVPMGEECVHWYAPLEAPPGLEELGVCVIPS